MQSTNKLLIQAKAISLQLPRQANALFADIDLTLHQQVYALVGRNGVGKSLLANILAGNLTPTTGNIQRFGTVGYLPQNSQAIAINQHLHYLKQLLNAYQKVLDGKGNNTDFELLENNWDIQQQITSLLDELNLPLTILQKPFDSLSGGEQTRLNLLSLKLQQFDFLILDEPSNHLDKQSRRWLASWVSHYKDGLLIVTHDEYLLERIANIYELTSLGLNCSHDGWQGYLQTKQQLQLGIAREIEQTSKTLQHAKIAKQKNTERIGKQQHQGKQKRANSNQSKLILDRQLNNSQATMSRISKLHQDRELTANKQLAAAKEKLEIIKPISITVAPPTKVANPLVCLQEVLLPFGSKQSINLTINNGELLAIAGNNGSGKTTLLKVISQAIPAISGKVYTTPSFKLIDQHLSCLDHSISAVANLQNYSPNWQQDQCRTCLAQLRLRGELAIKPVSQLSGGEQLKVALACLLCGEQAPALLLLDEPDNHLDMESKQLLITTLNQYQGAFIIISHSDYFIEQLAATTQISL